MGIVAAAAGTRALIPFFHTRLATPHDGLVSVARARPGLGEAWIPPGAGRRAWGSSPRRRGAGPGGPGRTGRGRAGRRRHRAGVKLVLVGHSMGGLVARHLAAAQPDLAAGRRSRRAGPNRARPSRKAETRSAASLPRCGVPMVSADHLYPAVAALRHRAGVKLVLVGHSMGGLVARHREG
jgi:pimeloyl-ACP methyl ester carboxylesterase